MSDVTIYTKTGCPYCAAAKKHYSDQGIDVVEINISDQPNMRDKLLEVSKGEAMVPVIVDSGKVTVGFGGG